jgi:hypothetical protein
MQSIFTNYCTLEFDDLYYSILPTTTAYARNAIFSGLMPSEIVANYKDYWTYDDEEGGKNKYEKELFAKLLERKKKDYSFSYHKIVRKEEGNKLVENFQNLLHNDLNIMVFNFIDALSHARTDMQMIRELASDEAAYRSISKSWLEHSPLFQVLQLIGETDRKVIVTTDHGTIRVKRAEKIVGDRNTNTNLRYKTGRNLSYNKKGSVFAMENPEDYFLPKRNMSSSFVFAEEDTFFAYPNNFNHYVKYYKDTFQHGGVSLEEVIVPFAEMRGRSKK